jgi:Trypsin-co-occurring domain 1
MENPPVKVVLENGAVLYIEPESASSGEERVGITLPSFKDVTNAIEGVAEALSESFKKVKPSSATVEFGIEVGMDAGKLTTLLVKGTANATLKITLIWGDIESVATVTGQ